MPWEIAAVALSLLALVSVVIMLWVALTEMLDPTTITHCRDCRRWTMDTRHGPAVLCFRCRHGHHSRQAHPPLARL